VSPTVLTAAELARAITAATHRPDETETLWAAVATVLREHPERGLEVLLIQRAEREGDPWSGHIAYPGGRYSSTDASMQHTAERETIEEVGLDLRAHARLLGRLSNVPARRNGQRVACYVYALTHDVEPQRSDEVADILWVPLRTFLEGTGRSTYPFTHEGQHYDLPCFRLGDRVLWGMTFWMLELLLEHAKTA
jgi:8-oxo-dGTP pyrophosphatase MutT (NUDIX family)